MPLGQARVPGAELLAQEASSPELDIFIDRGRRRAIRDAVKPLDVLAAQRADPGCASTTESLNLFLSAPLKCIRASTA